MPRGQRTRIAPGIYQDALGFAAVVVLGSRATRRSREERFTPQTPIATMEAWQQRTRKVLAAGAPSPAPRGRHDATLAGDADTYLSTVTSMPSYEARRADLEAWLPEYGQRDRHSLTAQELTATINRWVEAGFAASTINHRRQALRSLFLYCDPDTTPPIDGTQRRQPPPLEARALTWDDVRELLAAFRPTKSGATLRVLAVTGLPPARVRALRPEHVDAAARTVFLVGRKKGQGTVSKTVRVTPEAVAALAAYFVWFPKGGGVAQNSWCVEWHKTVARVNAKRAETGRPPLPRSTEATPAAHQLRPYDLRHSFGTEVYRRTGDLKAAAEMLDVTLETAQRYTLGAVSHQIEKAVAVMEDPTTVWQGGNALASGDRPTGEGLAPQGMGWHGANPPVSTGQHMAETGTNSSIPDRRANPSRLVKFPENRAKTEQIS